MSQEVDLRQKAAYWAYASLDKNGKPQVSAAIEIDVHWEHGKRQSITDQGTPTAVGATVLVDREIALHSFLRLGKLDSVPSTVNNAYEVIDYEEVPDVKGQDIQRTVTLGKASRTLPTIV